MSDINGSHAGNFLQGKDSSHRRPYTMSLTEMSLTNGFFTALSMTDAKGGTRRNLVQCALHIDDQTSGNSG